jgi:4-amino-4-deoxy-L-arabinose transferase-like glycosyltransferase
VVRSWHAGLWLAGIVKGIINYLPAALLLPCVWWRPWLAALPMAIQRRQRALRLALLLSFIAVSLLPGVRPRYYMPLFPLASILIATAVAGVPIDSALLRWWRRLAGVASGAAVAAAALALLLLPTGALAFVFARLHIPMSVALLDAFRPWLWPGIILLAAIAAHAALKPLRAMSWTGTDAVLITGVILTVIGLGVTSYAVPIKQAVEIRRPMGEALTARVPVNTRLTVYRSGYEPFYYYCLRPVEYCWRQRDLQPTMNRIVTLPLWITEVTNAPAVSGRVRHVELLPYRHKSFAMISCDGPDDAAALGEAGHRTTPVQ